MNTNTPAETLTDDMIHALLREAGEAGDTGAVEMCRCALGETTRLAYGRGTAKRAVADMITDARARDDSRPFVRTVVP